MMKHKDIIFALHYAQSLSKEHTKVGAVIIADGELSAQACNVDYGIGHKHKDDKICHAEISALSKQQLISHAKTRDIYITHIPCSRCAVAIKEAGIRNVYIESKVEPKAKYNHKFSLKLLHKQIVWL